MLRMKESRLIKWVVERPCKWNLKSNWQKDLEKSLAELGWAAVKRAGLESLSVTEIGMRQCMEECKVQVGS